MQITIGLFAGIFNEKGKILIRRRKSENLKGSCSHEGDWELPGGTMEKGNIWEKKDERIIGEELARELKEEIGVLIKVPFMPMMFPAVNVNKEYEIIDFAFIIPKVKLCEKPIKGENMYVSPKELNNLAKQPKGSRIVSGFGKRMHRMILKTLCFSSNAKYAREAKKILSEIHESMS